MRIEQLALCRRGLRRSLAADRSPLFLLIVGTGGSVYTTLLSGGSAEGDEVAIGFLDQHDQSVRIVAVRKDRGLTPAQPPQSSRPAPSLAGAALALVLFAINHPSARPVGQARRGFRGVGFSCASCGGNSGMALLRALVVHQVAIVVTMSQSGP